MFLKNVKNLDMYQKMFYICDINQNPKSYGSIED